MSLLLEIEFLLGIAFMARGQDSAEPDWPPQPDRVFSALVAAWASRGCRPDERAALEWLEALPPPQVHASTFEARPAPAVYVPPNDDATRKLGNLKVLPARRSRQPRRFPAALPHDPNVQLLWGRAEPEGETLAALEALARDVPNIGHSASLVRCRFRPGTEAAATDLQQARYTVYPGRLRELEAAFARNQRPGRGHAEPAASPVAPLVPATVFGRDWIALEHAAGPMPDIRAAAVLAKRIRDTILSGYGAGPVPEIISGHTPDGDPSRLPHLAIVPLAFLGYPHADGAVHGFALILPRAHEAALARAAAGAADEEALAAQAVQDGLYYALRRASERDPETRRRRLRLYARGDGTAISLDFGGQGSGKASLAPDRYCNASRLWASATPIVLDRHLKQKPGPDREAEIVDLLKAACTNIGWPKPERVSAHKHAALEGTPPARPSGRNPHWMQWRLARSQQSRNLTHAVLEFSEPVAGPGLLGASRHFGLGLCLPLKDGVEP